MGTVRRLAAEVARGLSEAHPKLRKTVVSKLALAVGAMIEARTPNTAELAHLLPLDTERQDMREQWLRRLLKNPLLSGSVLLKPWASEGLADASRQGQTVVLSLDQTDLGDRFAVLMLGLVIGDRAVPLAWTVEAGSANIGFAGQEAVLERVRGWLPAGAAVLLLADRFYPSVDLFEWLHRHGWRYRLRLKGNLSVDPGFGDPVTTAELAHGCIERYLSDVRLFAGETPTNRGMLHEPGHDEPRIIAMNCTPTRAAVRDYGNRRGIEPLFSDLKSRGFRLGATQLRAPDRLDHLLLIMALALYGCVRAGQEDACDHPTPLEKNSSTNRSPPLDLSKPRPQCPLLVQARFAVAPETTPNRTTVTSLLSHWHDNEKLIGGKVFVRTIGLKSLDVVSSSHHVILMKGQVAMRTTLDIDEDILAAAKELARRQRLSTGRVVSRLLRQGLTGQGLPVVAASQPEASVAPATGFRPFPAGRLVTNDQVDALREAEGV